MSNIKNAKYRIKNEQGQYEVIHFETSMGQVVGLDEKVAEVEIPNVRLLDGTYMPYKDYLEMKEEKGDIISDLASKGQAVDVIESDDLPF